MDKSEVTEVGIKTKRAHGTTGGASLSNTVVVIEGNKWCTNYSTPRHIMH